jgi:hypothetical protein
VKQEEHSFNLRVWWPLPNTKKTAFPCNANSLFSSLFLCFSLQKKLGRMKSLLNFSKADDSLTITIISMRDIAEKSPQQQHFEGNNITNPCISSAENLQSEVALQLAHTQYNHAKLLWMWRALSPHLLPKLHIKSSSIHSLANQIYSIATYRIHLLFRLTAVSSALGVWHS